MKTTIFILRKTGYISIGRCQSLNVSTRKIATIRSAFLKKKIWRENIFEPFFSQVTIFFGWNFFWGRTKSFGQHMNLGQKNLNIFFSKNTFRQQTFYWRKYSWQKSYFLKKNIYVTKKIKTKNLVEKKCFKVVLG